ncbi:MAG: hypothetical protein HFH08_05465 [Bacilli bacterium]|nr:hypothetical protein [Bacilli bacterium]
MEKAVKEALSLLLEDWLEDSRGKTFDLETDDIGSTKNIFCTCLDAHAIEYKLLEDKLIIGNKKICFYKKMAEYYQ